MNSVPLSPGPGLRFPMMVPMGLLLLAIVGLFVLPFLVRWVWNLTIPDLFHGPHLTYWQTFRLLVLAWILFGGLRFL